MLSIGLDAQAQETASTIDPAIAKLAARIAEPLRKARAKKVIVVDLRGPELQSHPVGKWLADQLSVALLKNFPELEIEDRSPLGAVANKDPVPGDQGAAFQNDMKRARFLGAKVMISGTFAKVPQGIGISLSSASPSNEKRLYVQASGVLPISEQFTGLFPNPIPAAESKNGLPKSGIGGVTNPECISCPNPQFSDQARMAHYEGNVILQVVVTAEGRTGKVWVVSGPGKGLEENAVRAVQGWRFKPAVDWDGNPVAVLTPIEVTFRLK